MERFIVSIVIICMIIASGFFIFSGKKGYFITGFTLLIVAIYGGIAYKIIKIDGSSDETTKNKTEIPQITDTNSVSGQIVEVLDYVVVKYDNGQIDTLKRTRPVTSVANKAENVKE